MVNKKELYKFVQEIQDEAKEQDFILERRLSENKKFFKFTVINKSAQELLNEA